MDDNVILIVRRSTGSRRRPPSIGERHDEGAGRRPRSSRSPSTPSCRRRRRCSPTSGAEVIKIEHVERGDAMRGLASTGVALVPDRRARPARALQPGQEEPRRSTSPARRARHPLPARRDLPTSSSPTSCRACARSWGSTSTTSGPTTRHHLRPRHRPGRARARRRQGLVRLARLLGPRRHRARCAAARVRPTSRCRRPRRSATRSAP